MIIVRRSEDRGRSQIGWLDGRHTFSFADYHDPEHMGFRALRVLNDDRVAPDSGFGPHPHRDMEIVTYVLDGALSHEDSMGNGSTIRPGDVQRMTAGRGVIHSEWNHSKTDPVHLLQIWIVPEKTGLPPSYEERRFEPTELRDSLRLIASRDGREGSVTIHQDATIHAGRLSRGIRIEHPLAMGRHVWVHVARGAMTVNGVELIEGDAAALTDESRIDLAATEDAEVLLFDLA